MSSEQVAMANRARACALYRQLCPDDLACHGDDAALVFQRGTNIALIESAFQEVERAQAFRVWEEAARQAGKGAVVWRAGLHNEREATALEEFAQWLCKQAQEERP